MRYIEIATGRRIDMTGEEAKEMLLEIEKQDGVRVERVLRVDWDAENDDAYLWSSNDCARCAKPLRAGDQGFVWAKPFTSKVTSTLSTLVTYCSEECLDDDMRDWSDETQCDVYIAYHCM